MAEARAKSEQHKGSLIALGIHNLAMEWAAELVQEQISIGGASVLAGEDAEAAGLIRDSYFSQFFVAPDTGERALKAALRGG